METLKKLTLKETFFLLLAPASTVFSLLFVRGIIYNSIKDPLISDIGMLMFSLIGLVIVLFTIYIHTISARIFPENTKKRNWLALLISISFIYYISLFVHPVAGIFFAVEFLISLGVNIVFCLAISAIIKRV